MFFLAQALVRFAWPSRSCRSHRSSTRPRKCRNWTPRWWRDCPAASSLQFPRRGRQGRRHHARARLVGVAVRSPRNVAAVTAWVVEVDAGEFELAMLNLCVNARDAMPDGATLTSSAANLVEAGENGLPTDYVHLSVVEPRAADTRQSRRMLSTAFVLFGAPVTWLEIVAFLLALACVALSVYEIHWGWPLAFVSSLLYAWLFAASKLYGEGALQLFFAATALWGWWQWLFGRRRGETPAAHLHVAQLDARSRWLALAAWLAAWLAVAALLLRYSDSDVRLRRRLRHRWQRHRPDPARPQVHRELACLGRRQPVLDRPVRLQGAVADRPALRRVRRARRRRLAALAPATAPTAAVRQPEPPAQPQACLPIRSCVQLISVLGAECTGKSTLCPALATAENGRWLAEYVREFCALHDRPPRQDEQAHVVAEQIRREQVAARESGRVFVDSSPLMTAIYSIHYFDDRSLLEPALAHQRSLRCHAGLRHRPAVDRRRPAARQCRPCACAARPCCSRRCSGAQHRLHARQRRPRHAHRDRPRPARVARSDIIRPTLGVPQNPRCAL